jgi:N-acetylglucosaminyldiphosphoundecaprenol N-acetyl-beta-D-mannosaminyltransferase
MDVASMEETVNSIRGRILDHAFTQHVVVNVAKLVHMRGDMQLRDSVCSCDIVNIDGMGVVWGARLLGHEVPERVAGVDLFHALIRMSAAERFPVYLLGATAEVVAETARRLKERHPTLSMAGFHHGYFWDDEARVVEEIKASGARLLFVAITSPRKENFINRWRSDLGVDATCWVRMVLSCPPGAKAHVEAIFDDKRQVRGAARARADSRPHPATIKAAMCRRLGAVAQRALQKFGVVEH